MLTASLVFLMVVLLLLKMLNKTREMEVTRRVRYQAIALTTHSSNYRGTSIRALLPTRASSWAAISS